MRRAAFTIFVPRPRHSLRLPSAISADYYYSFSLFRNGGSNCNPNACVPHDASPDSKPFSTQSSPSQQGNDFFWTNPLRRRVLLGLISHDGTDRRNPQHQYLPHRSEWFWFCHDSCWLIAIFLFVKLFRYFLTDFLTRAKHLKKIEFSDEHRCVVLFNFSPGSEFICHHAGVVIPKWLALGSGVSWAFGYAKFCPYYFSFCLVMNVASRDEWLHFLELLFTCRLLLIDTHLPCLNVVTITHFPEYCLLLYGLLSVY